MRVGIMQPYFLPYIGYYQLISAVDAFVVYDNIKYTKKGWINRNRFLRNSTDAIFSLPIAHASDLLEVKDRQISPTYNPKSFIAQVAGAYRRAPHFLNAMPLIEEVATYEDLNLFSFVMNAIQRSCAHLNIDTKFIVSSQIQIDPELKGEQRVLATCEAVGAKTYINPIGGTELYSKDTFLDRSVDLQFLKPQYVQYDQFEAPFVPWLSILDVLMFNSPEAIAHRLLPAYELV